MTELRLHEARLTAPVRELRVHSAWLSAEPPEVDTELRIHWAGLTSDGPSPVGPGRVYYYLDGTWVPCRVWVYIDGQWT